MSNTGNQRIRLTKCLIHEAMIELLREKDIRQISIREFRERAGINRTTFYNHYGSQYDVLKELSDQYLEDIARTVEGAEFRSREKTHERAAMVLQYMQDNRKLSLLLLRNNIDETFAARLFSLPKIEDMLNEALLGISDPLEKQSRISFAFYGSYKVLRDWLDAEERISPVQESELILKLAGDVCKQ